MRTPITYYGGKQQLSSIIISMIPSHKIYCEPFFGGGSVFFSKSKSYLEVINDHNDRLMTFYRQCVDNFEELQKKITLSLHSESEYRLARDYYNGNKNCNDLEIAWAVWMLTNFSFAGSMKGGWKWDNGRSGSHVAITAKIKRSEFIDAIKTKLSEVQISCRPALDVIKQRDTIDTFFYLDPPYPGATQGHYKGYTHNDLFELLKLLENIKGKFILSNYWCQTIRYFVLKNSWNVYKIDMPLKVANLTKSSRKEEVLISNFTNPELLF